MSIQSWLSVTPTSPSVKRKNHEDEVNEETPQAKKRTFSKLATQQSYDWYVKDKNEIWHCTLCREAKHDNPYAKGHAKPGKTTNHQRHSSSASHQSAIVRSTLQTQQPLQRMIINKLDKDEENVVGFMKIAYWLAKRELPKSEFGHVVELGSLLGVELSKDNAVKYTSNQAVSEFQSVLSDVVLNECLDKVRDSIYYSIALDESTDSANSKRLVVYCTALNTNLNTCLLANIEIADSNATADIIMQKLLHELKLNKLDVNKMVGIATDGASVMTGRKNGLVTKLREYSPGLIGIHCAAHRCALAASQAANAVPMIKEFSRTISSIFNYFSNSSLRCNRLKQIEAVLDIPQLKYAQVHAVRWLSLGRAVSVVYRTYPALVMALSLEVDGMAKSLMKEITQYKFIALLHLMMDVLPYLTKLSKYFQTENLNFSGIGPIVKSTCLALEDIGEEGGAFISKLETFVVSTDGNYCYERPASESHCDIVNKGVSENMEGFEGFDDSTDSHEKVSTINLKNYNLQANILTNVKKQYIANIISNLEDRFGESTLIEAMHVLTPNAIVENKSIPLYGEVELGILIANYQQNFTINMEQCILEYKQFKKLVTCSYSTHSFIDVVSVVNMIYSSIFQNLNVILKCVALLPVSTAQCERGFSTQNRIKNRFRSLLSNKSLTDLMRISEDGPSVSDFDYRRAMLVWKSQKKRKVFSR